MRLKFNIQMERKKANTEPIRGYLLAIISVGTLKISGRLAKHIKVKSLKKSSFSSLNIKPKIKIKAEEKKISTNISTVSLTERWLDNLLTNNIERKAWKNRLLSKLRSKYL